VVKPGQYIWRAKDHDQLVVVEAVLGEVEGRIYVKIQGSNTGIPFDECRPVKPANKSIKPPPSKLF
jgi:hypothetical protein